ncbi:MAG: bifunctional DNA-binding transcriptional regulator/O6-methylguanine-DNA methyltransferase Ada [Beijerinckiaceae bacterium]|nr:bifunctional DNA-binding transcriptional regulator/O6-methylguanine-DNA methyltransferase Ada [Beijerinckiaceae bacterium]
MQLKENFTKLPAAQARMWRAVTARDSTFDGQFYYAVKTTGVYCHPSCPSRACHPGNVSFYLTCEDAERAGFRPCKRCKPYEPALAARHAAMVAAACRHIESSGEIPRLEDMARRAKLSPSHFHRIFRAVTGLTPRAYAVAQRANRVKSALAEPGTAITAAIYKAGFNSSGRFYEASGSLLGMTPAKYRNGGSGTEIRFAVGACSLGFVLVARSARGVCAILLGDEPDTLAHDLRNRFPRAQIACGGVNFEALVAKVIAMVETPSLGLELPLDVRGTAFQQRVWQALREIPAGETASYAEIAKRIGAPDSARAVGRACAANVVAVAIPCHRAVRSGGAISGYRWGVARKRALLKREAGN